MTIDELLDTWERTEPIAMSNIGVAEAFFRKHFSSLHTSPAGYTRAFDALNKPVPWKKLTEFDRRMMTDIIETSGLYAGAAGKTFCRTKRPTMSDWKTNTGKALGPLLGTTALREVMSTMLTSQLVPSLKLAVCKHASACDWLTHSKLDGIIALLPVQEHERLMHLPWSSKEADTDAFKRLAQRSCPQMYPMLELLLSSSDWTCRAAVAAAGMQCFAKKKPIEQFALPEELHP